MGEVNQKKSFYEYNGGSTEERTLATPGNNNYYNFSARSESKLKMT